MNTGTKVLVGTLVAGGMIGLAIALGKEKPKRMPVPAPTEPPGGGPVGGGVMLPFRVSETPGDGPNGLEITDASAMVKWIANAVKQLKLGKLAMADDVLGQLAVMISKKRIGSVRLKQLPKLGQVRWEDLLDLVKGVPWKGVLPLAKSFLKGQGIS